MLSQVFKAYDVRAVYPAPLNEDLGWRIGLATAQWLRAKPGVSAASKVVVSRDHRPAAPGMAEALIKGLRAGGLNVVDLGRCDTSIQYFAVPHFNAAGGVQCTASHNPIKYIGYKFSGAGAVPVGRDTGLKEIQALAEKITDAACPPPTGTYETADVWALYRAHILKFMGELPRKVRVFVDASNGCGTTLLEKVFANVPNLEVVSINTAWTDQWAHEPNPLVAENMVPTQNGVRAGGFDLGACFDGDADRCMLTDETGATIGCDHLTAALAGHFIKLNPGAGIVFDLRSSKAAEEAVVAAGGAAHISAVGHVNLKKLLRDTHSVFGGELSGHFYFRDNSFADSGAITLAVAVGIISRSGQKLSSYINPHRKYPQSGEINFTCEDKAGVIAALKKDYASQGKLFELDGLSIDAWDKAGFWFNVRASNTEPVLRLNAEAKTAEGLAALLAALKPRLGHEAHGH